YAPMQMQQERRQRGITLVITGVGGELFKDFWWLQDFPFYSKSRSNLDKLYRLRVAPHEPEHGYLTGVYLQISREYRHTFVKRASTLRAASNTKTYDRVYYSRMGDIAGRLMSNHMPIVHSYAPYLDPDMAAIGYDLRRFQRFFCNFHRHT